MSDKFPVPEAPATEHDLSLLAFERDLPPPPRWDELLDQGMPPCLALGAERRTRGPR